MWEHTGAEEVTLYDIYSLGNSYHEVNIVSFHVVSYLKRAQIFAADVWHRFGGQDYGEFHDIDTLTMFADYRCVWNISRQ